MIAAESLKSHAAYEVLERVIEAADHALALEDLTDEQVHSLERTSAVACAARARLASTNAYLVPSAALPSILDAATRWANNLATFVNTRNSEHLQAMDQASDEVLRILPRLQSIDSTRQIEALTDSATQYRRSIDTLARSAKGRLGSIQAEITALKERLNEISTSMAEERSRLASVTTDFVKQFSDAQDQRTRTFTQHAEERDKAVKGKIADHDKTLNDQVIAFQNELRGMSEQRTELLNALKVEFEEGAEEIVAEVRSKRDEVKLLVGAIGDDGVRSGYVTTANTFKKATYLWQAVTVLAFALLIGLGWNQIAAFSQASPSSINWQLLVAKIFVALGMGAFAAYAATQAERAASSERRNRKLALELAAMGPFLTLLPKEEQDKFKVSVGDRYFGHVEADSEIKHSATIISTLGKDKELRRLLIDLAKVIRGS